MPTVCAGRGHRESKVERHRADTGTAKSLRAAPGNVIAEHCVELLLSGSRAAETTMRSSERTARAHRDLGRPLSWQNRSPQALAASLPRAAFGDLLRSGDDVDIVHLHQRDSSPAPTVGNLAACPPRRLTGAVDVNQLSLVSFPMLSISVGNRKRESDSPLSFCPCGSGSPLCSGGARPRLNLPPVW